MQEGGFDTVHVAPLRIRKSQKDLRVNVRSNTTSPVEYDVQYNKQLPEEPCSPRVRFQNFLRASYPFQPHDQFSSTSVTLPLAAGDIVLVHSIHTNGWADGTLLETGARGWLPTNYCEPYDYATMRPLLKALTEFWDIIRNDGDTTVELYRNHDYMRGMVAGVRFLLEKSNCLTRDALVVRQYDNIRKTRKALLADLSLLVKASKQVQGSGLSSESPDFDKVLDDMLLKAFQVVTRAVMFFDIWSEEMAFTKSSASSPQPEPFSEEPVVQSDANTPPDTGQGKNLRLSQNQTSLVGSAVHHYSRPRPASISRTATLTHRMSYVGRSAQNFKGNLASEQLSDTYDAFLGVLASFLGSHMQSRSSSELLLTTQQAVKSCRKLLEIIEIILEHDMSHTGGLQDAKDVMYDKITELVHAAREVFRPLQSDDEDMIYLPGEGARLVNAATACVSGAGRCVAKAKVLLEEVGDFELELRPDLSRIGSASDMCSVKSSFEPSFTALESVSSSRRPSKPRLNIPQHLQISVTGHDGHEVSGTPATSSYWTPITGAIESPTSESSVSSAEVNTVEIPQHDQQQRSLARAVLHGSDSTLVSSVRDSGPSFVSQTSTRATSPDSHSKGSPRSIEDDRDDGEDALLEHYYAHELIVNPEGRIIGGSLNAIIERLTSHDATPDSSFMTMVYLTFRLFATPLEFAQALVQRFDYVEQCPRIATPVRLRVSNVFKGWLESHWRHDCDEPTIPFIASFVKEKAMGTSKTAGNRLLGLIDIVATSHGPAVPRVLSAMGKTNTASPSTDPDQPAPSPILSKSQLNALKTWKMGGSGLSVLDFDPLELARQLTIKTSEIFCSILPEELLGCEFMKQSSSLAVNVRALSQLSTDISNLVIDSILLPEDTKKRAGIIKHWIKIAAKCLELNNYETLMTITASLSASSILRLHLTWDQVGQKTRATHEQLKEVCSHAKNYAGLRQRFEMIQPPCLPFVGIYRTDLTMIDQGCQATRELKTGDQTISVINLDKHNRTAKIISDLQRFQVNYRLTSVDELQTWMQNECINVRASGDRNVQVQYRRSLILEPKVNLQAARQSTKIKAFASMTSLTNKDKFDFLNWTNHTKERNTSVGAL